MKKIIGMITAGAMLLPLNVMASDLSGWAEPNFEMATQAGLLSYSVVSNNLQGNITRAEFCGLVVKLYERITGKTSEEDLENPFTDCNDSAVLLAYSKGIVSGREENLFDPDGLVTRQEMSKILINTLKAAEVNVVVLKSEEDEIAKGYTDLSDVSEWAGIELSIALKYGIICGDESGAVLPLGYATREQAISLIDRTYTQFAQSKTSFTVPEFTSVYDGYVTSGNISLAWTPIDGAANYKVIIKDSAFVPTVLLDTKKTSVTIGADKLKIGQEYTVTVGTLLENGTEVFSIPIKLIYQDSNTAYNSAYYVSNSKEAVSEKEQRVFPGGKSFESAEEAAANMKEVAVPVWVLKSNGTKVSSKKHLTVNQNLAEDVIAIFTEIYNDPSQFPIKDVGGYSWRTTAFGSVSQHSYGTCIDINYNENYYSTNDGTPITGEYWKPGEDPYSIPADSIVVKTFAKYGWLWGGNAWGPNGLRDYMHFTYLGK